MKFCIFCAIKSRDDFDATNTIKANLKLIIFLHDVNKNILTVRPLKCHFQPLRSSHSWTRPTFCKIQQLAASETKQKLLSRAFKAAFHTNVNKLSSFSKQIRWEMSITPVFQPYPHCYKPLKHLKQTNKNLNVFIS